MATIGADQVKVLREQTGAGYLECKKALTESNGNMEAAVRILRAKGASIALEKAGRAAKQGLVGSYVHSGRIGVLVEINCETDFVARTDEFKNFVSEICLQIASMNPKYVTREEIPQEEISMLKKEQVEKYCKETVLMEQSYVRDTGKTIKDLLHDTVTGIRENIVIRRFVRIVLGETGGLASNPSSP